MNDWRINIEKLWETIDDGPVMQGREKGKKFRYKE